MVTLVVAHSRNGCIGRDGNLPWRLPTDLKRFKEITLGGTVVMGRRTWESLPPAFCPLPGRRNLVLSTDPAYAPPGAEVFASLEAALDACDADCFVIGGGATYARALPLASRVLATLVDADVEGDAFFPELDGSWQCAEVSEPVTENGHTFTFRRYERA